MNVIITREEALKLNGSEYGITSGKKDSNGVRPTIYFCSNLVFLSNFDREKEFIEI